ncbi:hypothetical protein AB0H83_50740 [Dactylosporangium sp. NPDC050688]|uniref:hypothetical protein n=1 Tax=Dactylosporangium sp. NPDC050688 TaxID=3157217 RepID=UPI00340931F2
MATVTSTTTAATTAATTATTTGTEPIAPAWAARLAYAWNNSPSRAARVARRCWDGRGQALPLVRSDSTSGEVSIAYAGLPVGEINLLQLLEHQRDAVAGPTAARTRSTVRWRDLEAGRWPDADLVVVGAEAHRTARLPSDRALLAPFRVHLVVDVAADPQEQQQRISKRERWEFRRNRKRSGWTLEEDPSPAALEFFYHRMHVPTMRLRHGERGRSEQLSVARDAVLRHGTLFFVRQGDQRVAGALCHRSDAGTLTTRLLGVLDGDPAHYDSGAFKAVYHLLLEWAGTHGVSQVDLFGTEALLSKGIFQWKRKFAPRVVLPPNHFATKRMYLRVVNDTPAVRDFLVANPLLAQAGAGFEPRYFTDARRPARLQVSAQCPGLPEPRIVDLDAWLGAS